MSTLLHLDSSGKGPMSVTRPLTQYFADQWQANTPGAKVIYRDLLTSDIPYVNAEIVGAFYTPPEQLTAAQKSLLAQSEEFINELIEADTYVFGVPMYNFGVPAVFKAYIDLAVRAGKTFSFEGGVPKGLLLHKRLVVLTGSGGEYKTAEMKGLDFVEPYLRALFGFLGVSNTQFISVNGHAPEAVAASSERAKKDITELLTVAAQPNR